MMKKRCVAVLNGGRDQVNFKWFDELKGDESLDLFRILATNAVGSLPYGDVRIDISGMNVAQSRNAIMDVCRVNQIDHLHMVDDDIEIIDTSIFDKYEQLSEILEIPYINNGYSNVVNDVAGRHNPRMKCKLGRYTEMEHAVIFNAHHQNGYSYYNLSELDGYTYDENINCMEDNMFIFKLIDGGKVPFFNFFADIEKSWEYINITDNSTIRQITNESVYADQEYLKGNGYKWEHFNDVDAVIEYIIKKIDKGDNDE
jgi:hypothetical protein